MKTLLGETDTKELLDFLKKNPQAWMETVIAKTSTGGTEYRVMLYGCDKGGELKKPIQAMYYLMDKS